MQPDNTTSPYMSLRIPASHFMILWTQNVVESTGSFTNETLLDQHFREKEPFDADRDDVLTENSAFLSLSFEPASACQLVHQLSADRSWGISTVLCTIRVIGTCRYLSQLESYRPSGVKIVLSNTSPQCPEQPCVVTSPDYSIK